MHAGITLNTNVCRIIDDGRLTSIIVPWSGVVGVYVV